MSLPWGYEDPGSMCGELLSVFRLLQLLWLTVEAPGSVASSIRRAGRFVLLFDQGRGGEIARENWWSRAQKVIALQLRRAGSILRRLGIELEGGFRLDLTEVDVGDPGRQENRIDPEVAEGLVDALGRPGEVEIVTPEGDNGTIVPAGLVESPSEAAIGPDDGDSAVHQRVVGTVGCWVK